MNNIISYAKIGVGLLISYTVVTLFTNVFFLGNTPALRPHPDQYLARKLNSQVGKLIAGLNFGSGKKAPETITPNEFTQFMSTAAANSLEKVTTGTYAATINGKKAIIIKGEEIPTNANAYLIGGKQVVFKTDGSPPSQSEVEKMMKEFDEFEATGK